MTKLDELKTLKDEFDNSKYYRQYCTDIEKCLSMDIKALGKRVKKLSRLGKKENERRRENKWKREIDKLQVVDILFTLSAADINHSLIRHYHHRGTQIVKATCSPA